MVIGSFNKKIYLFLSSWAGGIQQILQYEWFLERAEFSHPDSSSILRPSYTSIYDQSTQVYLCSPLHGKESHRKEI